MRSSYPHPCPHPWIRLFPTIGAALLGATCFFGCVPSGNVVFTDAGPGAGSGGAPTGTGGAGISTGGISGGGSGGAPGTGGTSTGSGGTSTGTGGTGTGGAGTGTGGAGTGTGGSGTGGRGGTTGSGGAGTGGAGSGGRGGATGGTGVGTGGAATGGAAGAGPVTFTPNIRLNDDTGSGQQYEVAMATGPNGLIMAGWMDERSTRVCAFTVSTDGGATFSKNVSISLSTGGQFVGDPAVAIDGGGTLYAGCMDYGIMQIRLMTSTDKGVTWTAVRSIQAAPDKPWLGGGTTEGTVFVSWLGDTAGVKRSTDRGVTWGTTQSIGNIIHGTDILANTGVGGPVHVAYNLDSNRNQLRYLRSKNGGTTWDATKDLVADMGTFCFSCSPRQHPIVGSGTDPTGRYVAITWTSRMAAGQADDDVWVVYSSNSGDTFTAPIRVNDNTNASRQFQSWAAVDRAGRVHVAWTDLRNGNNATFYARSANPSQGWEKNLEVTDMRGQANQDFLGDYKSIAISGNDVVVVWNDTRRGNSDIYFSRAIGAAAP